MPLMSDNGLTPQEIRKLVSSGVLVPVDHAKRWMASHGMNNESPPTYNQAAQNAGFALNPALAFAQPQQSRVPASATKRRVSEHPGLTRSGLPEDAAKMMRNQGLPSSVAPQGTPPITPIPVQPPRTSTGSGYPQLPPVQPPGPYQPPAPYSSSQSETPWWLQQGSGFLGFGQPQQQLPPQPGQRIATRSVAMPLQQNAVRANNSIQRQPAQPFQLPKNFVVTDAMKKAAIAGMIR